MWFEDTRHGQGVMTFARGGGYEGQWQYDKECGHGHCVFPCGDKYTGLNSRLPPRLSFSPPHNIPAAFQANGLMASCMGKAR